MTMRPSRRSSKPSRPSWSGGGHGQPGGKLRWQSSNTSMASTIRGGGTQHWAGKARSPSNGKWLKRALGAARKRDRSIRRDRLEAPICLIASRRNIPCPIKISICRNFEITVSGFGQLFASHGPQCHKYNDGAIQMERFNRLIAA